METNPLTPAVAAFTVSFFCSMGGVSGAFLLLPWQMSWLGYVTPGVSATNQIFNLLACPAGVWRYAREKRLLFPLAFFVAAGSLPGVFIGAVLRLTVLSRQDYFLLFASLALFYLAYRTFKAKGKKRGATTGTVSVLEFNSRGFAFEFEGETYRVASRPLFWMSFAVGVAGGAYGVGGGAVMSPFLVSVTGLPVRAVAGATLLATFAASLAGVLFYSALAAVWEAPWGAPDFGLGLLLGAGGVFGAWLGASCQKYVPERFLRLALAMVVLGLALWYFLKACLSVF